MNEVDPYHHEEQEKPRTRLIAYVGSYGVGVPVVGGGISVFEVSGDGLSLILCGSVDQPKLAGRLAYAPQLGTLYAVDERKTDGRGPVEPAASVHAFRVHPESGQLTWLNSQLAPGPRPAYLAVSEEMRILVTANHGDFDHVERVIQTADGKWSTEYLYDDSTVIQYGLGEDGSISDIQDLKVLTGHGTDPNSHPQQAAGHAQASPHAHCAVVDLSGRYLLVCDKSTARIYVFRLGSKLEIVFTYQLPTETAPRHVAFDPNTGRVYVTCELSSELASFHFDTSCGELRLIDKQPTVDSLYTDPNEPAEVRAHPRGGFVYVNNRGEDSVAWFRVAPDGRLSRMGHVSISIGRYIHPKFGTRSFEFSPSGAFMLLADRPANMLRSYAVDAKNGSLQPLAEVAVSNPACIVFAEIASANST
jgi:6-phosphogluconolactonase